MEDLGGEEDEEDKDRAENKMVKVETGVLCQFWVGAETSPQWSGGDLVD